MKSYILPIVVEPDDDRWRAFAPVLEARGAATWGYTKDEALKNIQAVAQIVVEDLLNDGEPLPSEVTVSDGPVVAVTVG